jgi:hypothetical protein
MSIWYTTKGATPEEESAAQERLVAAWEDAPLSNLEVCGMLLDVAKGQVIAYAPEPGEGDDLAGNPPANYVLAQLQQAINLWNAGRVSSDGNMGDGSYTFTPRPLDKTIRGIIRPIDGKPDVY